MRTFLTTAALLLATGAGAALPAIEDLDALDARIAVFLGGTPADAGVRAQALDRRLRLVRCPEGAMFEAPAMGAVGVSCPSKGWRLRVPLTAPFAAAAPQAEVVIRKGDAVELAYGGAGFDILTTATAMEDGRAGGMVRVKTPTGAAVVTARVRGPGAVAIGN